MLLLLLLLPLGRLKLKPRVNANDPGGIGQLKPGARVNDPGKALSGRWSTTSARPPPANDLAEIERAHAEGQLKLGARVNYPGKALSGRRSTTSARPPPANDVAEIDARIQHILCKVIPGGCQWDDDDGGALRGRPRFRNRKRGRLMTTRPTEEEAAEAAEEAEEAEEAEAVVAPRKRRRLSPEDRHVYLVVGLGLCFVMWLTGRLTPTLRRKYLAAVAAGGVEEGFAALAGGLVAEGLDQPAQVAEQQAPAATQRSNIILRPRPRSGNASPAPQRWPAAPKRSPSPTRRRPDHSPGRSGSVPGLRPARSPARGRR